MCRVVSDNIKKTVTELKNTVEDKVLSAAWSDLYLYHYMHYTDQLTGTGARHVTDDVTSTCQLRID